MAIWMKIGANLVNVEYIVGAEERRYFVGPRAVRDGCDIHLTDGRMVFYPGSLDKFVEELSHLSEQSSTASVEEE